MGSVSLGACTFKLPGFPHVSERSEAKPSSSAFPPGVAPDFRDVKISWRDPRFVLPALKHCAEFIASVGGSAPTLDGWAQVTPTTRDLRIARERLQQDQLVNLDPAKDGIWMTRNSRAGTWFPFETGPSLHGNIWRSGKIYGHKVIKIAEAPTDRLKQIFQTTSNRGCPIATRCHNAVEAVLRARGSL